MKGSLMVAKKTEGVPIWLLRLDLVAKQLQAERPLPLRAEERIDMALSLMAEGLASLNVRAGTRDGRRVAGIMPVAKDQLSAFHRLDAEWARRWRRERGRAFGR